MSAGFGQGPEDLHGEAQNCVERRPFVLQRVHFQVEEPEGALRLLLIEQIALGFSQPRTAEA